MKKEFECDLCGVHHSSVILCVGDGKKEKNGFFIKLLRFLSLPLSLVSVLARRVGENDKEGVKKWKLDEIFLISFSFMSKAKSKLLEQIFGRERERDHF